MKVVSIQDAKKHLSRLVEQVWEGEEFLIGKYGKPMARLTRFAPEPAERPLGGLEGKIRIAEDFDSDNPRINALFGAGAKP